MPISSCSLIEASREPPEVTKILFGEELVQLHLPHLLVAISVVEKSDVNYYLTAFLPQINSSLMEPVFSHILIYNINQYISHSCM